MSEPSEVKAIETLVSKHFPEEDNDTACAIRTVVPTRTFLEKAFLLNEEFQKNKPRHVRMSRHLYDLERLMDTEFGRAALADRELYEEIVKHRETYNVLKYVDYGKHAPERIDFVPPEAVMADWSRDYDNMLESFIYGKALSFDELIARIRELRERFRKV